MADSVDFDLTELTRLAADLGDVPDNAGKNVGKAIVVSSIKVKKSWQEPLKGSSQLFGLPAAVDFEVIASPGSDVSNVRSEIGFNKSKTQGPLGNISEYGTPTTTGRGYGIKALHDNEDDFVKGLAIALADAEKEAGL